MVYLLSHLAGGYDREGLNERLGTMHYHSGIHVPDGVLLQPAALVRGLAVGNLH